LNLTNGTLDLGTNLIVTSIGGTGGSILNNQTTNASQLFVLGASTVNSLISGKVALSVLGGTVRLNAANTYSNGTTLASGAVLAFGSGAANAGSVAIIASNGAALNMPNTGSSSSAPNTPVKTVDGAQVTFTSSTTANAWAGQFTGSAVATNIYSGGNMTISGSNSFSGFLGTVIVTNGEVRWFNAACGGDNTTFYFVNGGGSFARDNVDIIRLGALFGNGVITMPSVSQPATYYIGAKPIDSVYSGSISGSNNIVKAGTNRLTLNGVIFTTNTDNATYTNYLYNSSIITYVNNTTISNGVLALVTPNTLTNSPNVTLAGTNAVLDATQMGYVSNLLDITSTPTNSFLVTNGIFTVVPGQILGGFGTVRGLVVNNGTIDPGLANSGGNLVLTNDLMVNSGATLGFDLSDDATGAVKANDQLIVYSNITLSGSITIAINALNGGIRSGTYPLIRYSGSLSNESGVVPNGLIPNFTLGGSYQALPGTMVLSNTPGVVILTVTNSAARNLTWTGDGVGNLWDVANSVTWLAGATPTNFYQVDSVRFTDSGAANPTVYLVGALAPSSLVVSNSNVYSFGSNGTIVSLTSLLKQGSGTLILSNGANSYTGGTLISNGVLNVGADSGGNQNDQALGTGVATVNGATAELRFGGNAGAVVNHFVSTPITMMNGGIVKAQDGVQHLTNSTVTLGAGGGVLQTVFVTKDLVLDSPLVGAGNLTVSVPGGFTGGRVVLNHGTNTLSGNITIAANGILALVNAAGITNSPVIDDQPGGILDATLRTGNTWTLQTGQTLYGNGVVRASVAVAAAGSIVSPGEPGALGTLTITNTVSTNTLATVTLAGTTVMELNRASSPNSDRLVCGTNNFGGTLTVNNLGGTLQAGDTFTLFVSTNKASFAVTNLPALGSGLVWSNSLAINGKLAVVATVNTNPTNITFSVSGNVLTLTWPPDHTGWRLLAQTNALSIGLVPSTNAWVTVPNSANVNTTNITVNPANGTVFYRLVYP
jgi:autotransporter-associated beta strand protein